MRPVPAFDLISPPGVEPGTHVLSSIDVFVAIGVVFAMRRARLNLTALRKDDDVKKEAQTIVKKHGSRAGMAGGIRDKNGNIIAKKSNKLMQGKVKSSKLNTADLKEKAKQQLLF